MLTDVVALHVSSYTCFSLLSLFTLPAISAISSWDTHIPIRTWGPTGAWFAWQAWWARDTTDETRCSSQSVVEQLPKDTVAQTGHSHQCPHLQLCKCKQQVLKNLWHDAWPSVSGFHMDLITSTNWKDLFAAIQISCVMLSLMQTEQKRKNLRSYCNLMIKRKMWPDVMRSHLIQWPFHPALNCIWDLKQKPLSQFQVCSAAKTFPSHDITSSTISVGGMSLWSTWPDWNIHFLYVTHRLRQRHIHTNTLPHFRVITLIHIFKHSIKRYVELRSLKSLGMISWFLEEHCPTNTCSCWLFSFWPCVGENISHLFSAPAVSDPVEGLKHVCHIYRHLNNFSQWKWVWLLQQLFSLAGHPCFICQHTTHQTKPVYCQIMWNKQEVHPPTHTRSRSVSVLKHVFDFQGN